VSYAIDKDASDAINSLAAIIKKDPSVNFKTLSSTFSGKSGIKANYNVSGWVPINNWDGGLSVAANKLNKLGISPIIKRATTDDGYYIVRLIDKNDTRLNYEYLNIPLSTFTKSLDKIEKDGKVSRYVSIPKITTSTK
jgi:hypothetical protein